MFSFFKKKSLLNQKVQQAVMKHIQAAESKTTGEIRVYVEEHCKYPDPLMRAGEVFAQLKMNQTSGRNAILIYLALADKKFALYGDEVIYEKAGGQQFWDKAAHQLKEHFKKNETEIGLTKCIDELGTALSNTFPYDPSVKKNELPDEIVFGK